MARWTLHFSGDATAYFYRFQLDRMVPPAHHATRHDNFLLTMNNSGLNRRHFIKTGLAGSLALTALNLAPKAAAAVTKPQSDPLSGLKVGVASYSMRSFPLDKAIAMTQELKVKYITLKDVHLSLKSTPEQIQEACKKIQDAGLILMGGGVIYLKNQEKQVHDAFEYCKSAGMPTMVASPDPDALDLVEKFAKQYDIRVAIHNHGPGDKHYPSPLDVLAMVKDRDAHMGICIDVGHTVRIKQDPIPAIQACASRLYDFHIKDVNEATGKGSPVEVGRGVIDIVAVLKTLIEVKYAGQVGLEYEIKAEAPMPGMIESFGYIRGILATCAA